MRKIITPIFLILLIFTLTSCSSNVFNKLFSSEPKDLKTCEEINNSKQRDNCYSQVASQLKDRSICKKIKDDHIKTVCFENFNLF
ncbi:MAG: lipoprotein [Patescibacteria group bacterium]|nr:lipoprotein [Patescibacteria group bacterium]